MILEIWFRLYIDGRSVESVREDVNAAVARSEQGAAVLAFAQA